MIVVQTLLLKKCFEIESNPVSDKGEPIIPSEEATERLHVTMSKLFTMFSLYFFIFMFYKNDTLTTITGSLSAGFEACLPLPQFLSNFRNKSVESVR